MKAEQLWKEYLENGGEDTVYDAWEFGGSTDLLARLVMCGAKTATASAYALYGIENEPLPTVGGYSVVLDSKGDAVCIIKTTKLYVTPFDKVTAEHAYKEGEGDRSLSYWRKVHKDFFTDCMREDGLEFSESMEVLCEEFTLVYKKEKCKLNLRLVELTEEYKTQLTDMMDEWYATGEKIVPYSIRKADYHDFGAYLKSLEPHDNVPGHVPATTFFCLDTDRNIFVGAVNIRHYLNEQLSLVGGHVGDGVRPSERRKGIATKMIELALEKCRGFGIERVLMTCDDDNIGSAKSIINNGGIYDGNVIVDGVSERRYWINI